MLSPSHLIILQITCFTSCHIRESSLYFQKPPASPSSPKKESGQMDPPLRAFSSAAPDIIKYYTTLSYIMLLFSFHSDFVYNKRIWEEFSMNTQKPLKVKVSITLDEDVIHQIRALAETDDRNFSQYINLVLKKHLNDTQKKEDGKK